MLDLAHLVSRRPQRMLAGLLDGRHALKVLF